MISRITGGDPMGAFQFNHGQQALELIEAGLMLDLTDVAEAEQLEGHRQPAVAAGQPAPSTAASTAPRSTSIRPSGCGCRTRPSRMRASPVPTNWDEFVAAARLSARRARLPLALGGQPWQSNLLRAITVGDGGPRPGRA
jgi:glucose/mannose transport system substrate-binding protein